MTYQNSHIDRRHVDKVDKRFLLIESVDIVDVSTWYWAIKSGTCMRWNARGWGGRKSAICNAETGRLAGCLWGIETTPWGFQGCYVVKALALVHRASYLLRLPLRFDLVRSPALMPMGRGWLKVWSPWTGNRPLNQIFTRAGFGRGGTPKEYME